jgi:hypothetical protein
MKSQGVIRSYRETWGRFQKICQAAGAVAKPSNGSTIKLVVDTPREIAVSSLLLLSNWRYKATSTRLKPISVLVRSKEHYVRASESMVKSTVQVMYLTIKGEEATPLLAMHYDFESPTQVAHPVFHAQMGESDFSKEELQEINLRANILPSKNALYSNVRIPTPCMNLGSVLLGLAADHLEPSFFAQVLDLIKRSDLVGWQANCTSLKKSLDASDRYLHSYHWYT